MDAIFFNRTMINKTELMVTSPRPLVVFNKQTSKTRSPRESVSQDLRNLFNTGAVKETESLPQLLAQGVPEWCESNDEDERVMSWFCRHLRHTLLYLEPRIKTLTVSVQQIDQPVLALRLDAVLWHDDERLTLELSWRNGHWY